MSVGVNVRKKRTFREIEERKALEPETEQRSSEPAWHGGTTVSYIISRVAVEKVTVSEFRALETILRKIFSSFQL